MAQQPKIVCVVGPTACGKTKLGVLLAKAYNGEVVSVDSMQIYRGMAIGTAAPTAEEMEGVPHHMVAVAEPEENWSVAKFAAAADRCVQDILARGKLPILVGGTGLYLEAVVSGRDFAPGAAGGHVRWELQQRLEREGVGPLLEELRAADPAAAARLHPSDTKRILRALEVFLETGETITAHNARTRAMPGRYDPVYIGLRFARREDMRALIDRRVDAMVDEGLLGEVEALLSPGRAQGGHLLPGHRLQGDPPLCAGALHLGRGGGGGETPLPAVRQAAAHLAAPEPGHPLDRLGGRARFC